MRNSPNRIMSEYERRDIPKHDGVRQVRRSRCMNLLWVDGFGLFRSCYCGCSRKTIRIQPIGFYDLCAEQSTPPKLNTPNKPRSVNEKTITYLLAQCISMTPLRAEIHRSTTANKSNPTHVPAIASALFSTYPWNHKLSPGVERNHISI